MDKLLKFQRKEITEHFIYKKLAEKHKENPELLKKIAEDELKHYNMIKEITKRDVKPRKFQILYYSILYRIFGITFTLKLMERNEELTIKDYKEFSEKYGEFSDIIKDEEEHEMRLLETIKEEKIQYLGSIVLGLNDALVELTGTLAGLTMALRNTHLIGIIGLITGIAASLSMAVSEYLSQKSEETLNPKKASFYTGLAYVFTTILLIIPFFVYENHFAALINTLLFAVFVIFIFTFVASVVKNKNFKKEFIEMLILSMGVAMVSFVIGLLIRSYFGIDI